jgi:hypothetical protein
MLTNLICVIGGMIVMWCLNYIIAVGHSVNILKQAQKNCASLFITSEQGLQEVLVLKYLAMKEANRTEQNITAQKYIDQMSIRSVQSAIMRNYVNSFPTNYLHLIEYTSWEELEQYVDNVMKRP